MTDSVVNEKYLNRLFEDLLREQTACLNRMKQGGTEIKDFSKETSRELAMLTDLMNRIVKFRLYREQLKSKQLA